WNEQGRGTYGVDIVDMPPVHDPSEAADVYRIRVLDRMAADPTLMWTQLARKARMYWSPLLPEYSAIHKLGAGLYFISFSLFALVGLATSRHNLALTTMSALGIVVFSLASTLTVVDYDLRYRLPVEFLMIPLCALGMNWVGVRLPF